MVGIDEARRIARLARLGLDADELQRLAGELTGLLAHIDVMRALPADPIADAATDAGDETPAGVPDADALQVAPPYFAPDWRDGFFAAPRSFRHQAGS